MCHATSAAIAKVNECPIRLHICPHTAMCILMLHHTSSLPVMHLCMCLIRICAYMDENGFDISLPQIDRLAIQPIQLHLRVQPLVDGVILRYVSIRQHTSAYVSIRQPF
jgi:hypothetical protein